MTNDVRLPKLPVWIQAFDKIREDGYLMST
jgi:hypothetical protein